MGLYNNNSTEEERETNYITVKFLYVIEMKSVLILTRLLLVKMLTGLSRATTKKINKKKRISKKAYNSSDK